MPNFANGKIYILWSKNTSDVYVGSTAIEMNKRKTLHKSDHKLQHKRKNVCRSTIVIDAGDWDMTEIESYPCNSKWELQQRERFHILNTPNAVNDRIPTDCKTKEEYGQQYYQQYKKQNADKMKAHNSATDTCPNCGATHRHDAKRKHQRTKTCTKIVDTEVNAVMQSMLDILCNA